VGFGVGHVGAVIYDGAKGMEITSPILFSRSYGSGDLGLVAAIGGYFPKDSSLRVAGGLDVQYRVPLMKTGEIYNAGFLGRIGWHSERQLSLAAGVYF
jgi:hypothetical protein